MEYWLKFAHWVYDMQGLLAVIVAFITLSVIFLHRKDDRLRKLWFAKSEANFAVVDTHGFLKSIVENLEADYFRFKRTLGTGTQFKSFNLTPVLAYPNDSIKTLASLIPVSDAKTASQIAEFTSFFQVYKSRLVSFEINCANASHGKSSTDFCERIYEQIELSSWLMQRFLPYVRSMDMHSMPDFDSTPDSSLIFDSKYLMHDAEYIEVSNQKKWPPDFQSKMTRWLERNS